MPRNIFSVNMKNIEIDGIYMCTLASVLLLMLYSLEAGPSMSSVNSGSDLQRQLFLIIPPN